MITSSLMPWYDPLKAMIKLRPVTVRAMRMAPSTASEPVLHTAARSPPVSSHNRLHTSAAKGCMGPMSTLWSSCLWQSSLMKLGM